MTNLELVTVLTVWITAYAPGCGATGPTKSGAWPTAGHTVAVDPKVFPLGTLFSIPSMPQVKPFIATDTGRKVKGLHLDVYVKTCPEARKIGRTKKTINVLRKKR